MMFLWHVLYKNKLQISISLIDQHVKFISVTLLNNRFLSDWYAHFLHKVVLHMKTGGVSQSLRKLSVQSQAKSEAASSRDGVDKHITWWQKPGNRHVSVCVISIPGLCGLQCEAYLTRKHLIFQHNTSPCNISALSSMIITIFSGSAWAICHFLWDTKWTAMTLQSLTLQTSENKGMFFYPKHL